MLVLFIVHTIPPWNIRVKSDIFKACSIFIEILIRRRTSEAFCRVPIVVSLNNDNINPYKRGKSGLFWIFVDKIDDCVRPCRM